MLYGRSVELRYVTIAIQFKLCVGISTVADEKQSIELGTADGFLRLYNKHFGTSFRVLEQSDAPDVRCIDDAGRQLNLEVTATEDSARDIQALLGRSDHKSFNALVAHNERVASGLEPPQFVAFEAVKKTLIARIKAKFDKDYGSNVALIVRDTSGCDWEWNEVAQEIACALESTRNPFDQGIWVLSRAKDKLFQIVEQQH